MQADERQVGARVEDGRRRAEELRPDQHGVQAADEEEDEDGNQVLQADDLVVCAHPPVAARAAGLALAQAGRMAEHAPNRVHVEPESDEPADHGAGVSEEKRHVVLAGVLDVVE